MTASNDILKPRVCAHADAMVKSNQTQLTIQNFVQQAYKYKQVNKVSGNGIHGDTNVVKKYYQSRASESLSAVYIGVTPHVLTSYCE